MPDEIRFYSHDTEHAFLSNFWHAPIALDGLVWATVEHYYQAQKYTQPVQKEFVRSADSPGEAKRRGRNWQCRADWDRIRDEVMYEAIYAKFTQNPDLRGKLLATGVARLIENSPNDRYWGGGLSGSQNRLGEILMRVRAELSESWTI